MLEAILDGTLEPGERIRDTELQEWFGVSRTPIRLAIDRLEEMHLVESMPNRFTRVSPVVPGSVPTSSRSCRHSGVSPSDLLFTSSPTPTPPNAARASTGANRACRRHSGGDASVIASEMRHALFRFGEISGNALLLSLVVRFESALRFQLSRQGASLDLGRMAAFFDHLGAAVETRDAAVAEAAFRDLACIDLVASGSR